MENVHLCPRFPPNDRRKCSPLSPTSSISPQRKCSPLSLEHSTTTEQSLCKRPIIFGKNSTTELVEIKLQNAHSLTVRETQYSDDGRCDYYNRYHFVEGGREQERPQTIAFCDEVGKPRGQKMDPGPLYASIDISRGRRCEPVENTIANTRTVLVLVNTRTEDTTTAQTCGQIQGTISS